MSFSQASIPVFQNILLLIRHAFLKRKKKKKEGKRKATKTKPGTGQPSRPVIPAPETGQEDYGEFKASLRCTAKPCVKSKQTKTTTTKQNRTKKNYQKLCGGVRIAEKSEKTA